MRFIVFEGIDGAGKSTQVRRLAAWLESRGERVCVTCEPTRGPYGRLIRESNPRLSPQEEREAFVNDRTEHVRECISPALDRGEIVLCDRYYYSSMAYQGARLAQLEPSPADSLPGIVDALRAENERFAPQAELLLYFDLPVDVAMQRIERNRTEADAFENRENLRRVAAAFEQTLAIVQRTSQTRIVRIDATLSPDAIHAQIAGCFLPED